MADGTFEAPDLTALLLETNSLDGFLSALADSALARTPEAEGCGITLERHGRALTVASAGGSALQLDEKQYGQDDGPCLQALRRSEEVMVTDMLSESRWGDYPPYAAACGTRSSLSLPIAVPTDSAHTAGALNLYSRKPDGFANADLVFLRGKAARAAGAIALAQRISDAQEFAEDLQHALKSRTVIDQAIGVIMGQRKCSADEAFAILRTASQHRNVKLRDLCGDLLSGIAGRPPQEPDLRPRP